MWHYNIFKISCQAFFQFFFFFFFFYFLFFYFYYIFLFFFLYLNILFFFFIKNKINNKINFNKLFKFYSLFYSYISKKNFILYGLYSDIKNKYHNCDYIYLNNTIIGQIIRPFKIWKLKHLAIIKIPIKDILLSGVIHNEISIGDNKGNSKCISLKKKHKGINYYSRKKVDDHFLLIRSTINSGAIRLVNLPMQEEYEKINLFKNEIAYLLSKLIKKKNIILMFEKESNKANESGFYVFERLMKLKKLKTKVFFIINKNSADFKKVINRYPSNTIVKYSFRHYLYIYLSKYFMSSELSNHVINPRLYIRNLNKEIAKKPLIFLQHGIMFAKPVDNPAANGFKKNNTTVNFYKCIISSDLEATQFYKLGYSNNDLIKCGLPKFDVSKLKEDANKIMLMLTYRYWEEGMVLNPELIKKTTYYQTYMKIIKAFEKNNLLENLIVSCHPKFVEVLQKVFSDKVNIEPDINKGLEESRIFISDFSSASYDAHYRGAYIIYYWEEKDYLIENYKAVPPIDETNCDGVPVYNVDELIAEVKKAIKNKYKMDKKYEDNYKKINEFHDDKNYIRLINELKRLGVLR